MTCTSNCGCSAAQPATEHHFRARGLEGPEEAAALRRALASLLPEDDIRIDVGLGKVSVPAGIDVGTEQLRRAALRANVELDDWRDEHGHEHAAQGDAWIKGLTIASGVAFSAGLALGFAGSQSLATGAYVFSAVLGATPIAGHAWESLRRLRADMHVLSMLAIVGGGLIGEWQEGAAVAFLFSLSILLEGWCVGRARRAIGELIGRAPKTARLLAEGDEAREVAVADIAVGDLLLIRPGEAVPLDGRIEQGATHVNQSPITGESRPVERAAGDEVFAGSINGEGALRLRVLRRAAETKLARIIRMVEEAQARRARVQRWTEKFAVAYTPLMIAVALAVGLVPPLLGAMAWGESLYRGLVVLVIACPCALLISIPVSIVAGLTRAAREGVLVKGGVFLEEAARIKAVAFDKTGTLTRGRLRVHDVIPADGAEPGALLRAAACLEVASEHPIAAAILEAADARGLGVKPAESFSAVPGMGAQGSVDGEAWWIGNERMAARFGATASWPGIDSDAAVLAVGRGARVEGFITLADTVRGDARDAVSQLHALGVKPTVMLTGDDSRVAQVIAHEVGIDEVLAGLLPEEKLAAVEKLVARHAHVAMVGDGINDAPPLAAATLSIAMARGGTDAAIETASVGLLRDDPALVPWLVAHARRVRAIVLQNVLFVLVVKALFLVMAALGMATLWMAVLADVGATLLVTANALRLLRAPGKVSVEGEADVAPEWVGTPAEV